MTPRALLLASTCLLVLGPHAPARADELRARLIAPSAQDELLVEALARVKGELSAAGFHVAVQRAAGAAPARTLIAGVKTQDASAAVIVVQRQPQDSNGIKTLQFRVYEPWGKETSIVRSEIDAGEPSLSAQRGAVQAVEVLRAVLARFGIDAGAAAEAQPRREEEPKTKSAPREHTENTKTKSVPREQKEDTTIESAPREQAARSGLVRVGTGLVLWSGFDGLGSSLTPFAAVAVALPGLPPNRDLALDLRVSAAGLGARFRLEPAEGTVQMRQALLVGELVLRLWPHAMLQPLFSLGGGAYSVSIEAEAETPFSARSPHTWSGLLGGGTGLMLAVSTHFAASVEAQLLSATAPSDVKVDGRVEAVAGAPMLMTGVQLMGGF